MSGWGSNWAALPQADPRPSRRDAVLDDCPECGHFQQWPYNDSLCGRCGYPDPGLMQSHREFERLSGEES